MHACAILVCCSFVGVHAGTVVYISVFSRLQDIMDVVPDLRTATYSIVKLGHFHCTS